jgi:hypothetical protein
MSGSTFSLFPDDASAWPAEPEGSGIRPGPELSADARLVQVVRAAVARAD